MEHATVVQGLAWRLYWT